MLDDYLPTALTPLRVVYDRLAQCWIDTEAWEGRPLPHDSVYHWLFGLWETQETEHWGARRRTDGALKRIDAALTERHPSCYDMAELHHHSCLRHRHGEAFYNMHLRRRGPHTVAIEGDPATQRVLLSPQVPLRRLRRPSQTERVAQLLCDAWVSTGMPYWGGMKEAFAATEKEFPDHKDLRLEDRARHNAFNLYLQTTANWQA